MTKRKYSKCIVLVLATGLFHAAADAQGTKGTTTFKRMKEYLDSVPAIDTHEHLMPFQNFQTKPGSRRGANLHTLWKSSYYTWYNPLTPWTESMPFEAWWQKAREDFKNARATSFYRYQLPIYDDLYGVEFEALTDEQARQLNDRIVENYRDQKWTYEVITQRANIELIVNDPFWNRLGMETIWGFEAPVLNVTSLTRGYHPSSYVRAPNEDPYLYAEKNNLPITTLDEYVAVIDTIFAEAKRRDVVCLKTTLAYERTLRFENVPKERAAPHFGKKKADLSAAEIKEFEDYIMWRLVELSARHDLPFQIHTGQARIQSSNPLQLVDMIAANRDTKFILFHGGYPWVDDAGVIVQRHSSHVWIDSCWLPTLSYNMAKRAYHEWLDGMPSNRILWGGDCLHADGIYGATEFTRRCLAEVLAERVDRGDLKEEYARRIGRQILRENALELFPPLKKKLWKHKQKRLDVPAE